MNLSGADENVLIAAMRVEARTARPLARCGFRVVVSGIGPEQARAAATATLDAGARRLLVWGTAGGLAPAQRSGMLLLPRFVIGADGERFETDAQWRGELQTRVPVGIAVGEAAVATVARPLADAGAKSALAARSGAEAVDMETGAIAAVAAARGVPFAAVRAIADPVELALPPVVLAAVSQRFLAPEVALRLLARPQDFAALRALARAMGAAKRSLGAFARNLAAAPRPSRLY